MNIENHQSPGRPKNKTFCRTLRGKLPSARTIRAKMLANPPTSAFPASGTTITSCTSSTSARSASQSPTPQSSSDRSSSGGASGPRGTTMSSADEAQACHNLLLLVRNDAQVLITLRNDNLDQLEGTTRPGGVPGGDTDRSLLLAAVNEAITYSAKSFTELGPLLEKHRWPAREPGAPSRRRSPAVGVRPPKILRRRRTQSPDTPAGAGADEESGISGELWFSWTVALTELHSAVLAATERLRVFLEYGVAAVAVSEEDRKKREGRASWWEQGRGEFENVGLIQSLMGRPRRKWDTNPTGTNTQATAATEPEAAGEEAADLEDDEPVTVLTPVLEADDTQSETLGSEPWSVPSTIKSTHGSLTARPRRAREGSLQEEAQFSVRRVVTDPLTSSPRKGSPPLDLHISRSETFGQAARCESDKDLGRASTTTEPPPSLAARQPKAGSSPAASSPVLPLATGAAQSRSSTRSSPTRAAPSPEAAYAPDTPLDEKLAALVVQRALPSKTFQPVIEALDDMIEAPVSSVSPPASPRKGTTALTVEPLRSRQRQSVHPVIEAAQDTTVVSPVSSPEPHHPRQSVPPPSEDSDVHRPFLAYMARKQAVSISRWSLGRSRVSEGERNESKT